MRTGRRLQLLRDWPMPADIVQRQVDVSTNMLATPYCPPSVVVSEYFIPGTDPIMPCDVHTGALMPDTSGVGTLYPRTDSLGRPIPGRPATGADTSRRYRDSTIFSLPSRDSIRRADSLRTDSLRKRLDSLRRRDTIRPPRPDTTRPLRPDSIRRPRPDTLQRSNPELE